MRRPVTIRIHEAVMTAVNAKAVKDERGYARVIEDILAAHFGIIGIQDDVQVVYAPVDIRQHKLVRDPRDTEAEHEELARAIDIMLEKAGY